MSRQKELDVDAKEITKIELIGKSKKRKDYGKNNDSAQSMFLLTIWRKKKIRITFSETSVTVL